MLVEFSVTNFRSIKETATISMVRGSGSEFAENNSINSDSPGTPTLLASAVVYGANAAGKSNIIAALAFMQDMVKRSAKESSSGDQIKVIPFLLDEYSGQRPSEFELVFVVDGIRYQYGFSANTERVYSEWLLSFPLGRPRHLIEREYDIEQNTYVWGPMGMLAGQKQLWQNSTRSNALFLSTAVQLNCEGLQPVFKWITRQLRVVDRPKWFQGFTAKRCLDDKSRIVIERLMQVADTDIQGIEVEEKQISFDEVSDYLPKSVQEKLQEKYSNKQVLVDHHVFTVHRKNNGERVKFDLETESSGTQKLFNMAGAWLDTLESGYTLVVDELNDSLHSHLVRFLISMFHDKKINTGAQLLLTTHDTSLLSQDIFRRDQIWLCEKNSEKATNLYPLTDFRPRKDVENLERGYLSGRYGAVPSIGNLERVLED